MAEKKASVAELAGLFIRKAGFREVDGAERQVLRFWRGDFCLWNGKTYRKFDKNEMNTMMVKIAASVGQVATVGLLKNMRLHIMAQLMSDEGKE